MHELTLRAGATTALLLLAGGSLGSTSAALTLCCGPDNDVYRLLSTNGVECRRADSFAEGVEAAPPGSGVLLLADEYPARTTPVDAQALQKARSRGLRLFVEYPDQLPGRKFAPVTSITVERVVVSSPAFGAELPELRILSASGCHYLPTSATQPLLSIARVAGYDRAIYGLPANSPPLLFEESGPDLLVATTGLSRFGKGRYGPTREWVTLWTRLLERLNGAPLPPLKWTAAVRPHFGPDDPLPSDVERRALTLAADWIDSSGLLLTKERSAAVQSLLRAKKEESGPFGPGESGDGSFGILEGYYSNIRWDGHQKQCLPVRADCNAETAMLLAMDGTLHSRPERNQVATRLLDFSYGPEGFTAGVRGNPQHPSYGHIAWGLYSPSWEIGNYGDDNARTILATLAAASLLKTDKWDLPVLRAIAANFRTTGKKGFRNDRVDIPEMEATGWKALGERDFVNLSPHFEAALWMCYLLAYERTGYAPFLEKTRTGIRLMMEAYPSGWRWQDNSERTDMLWVLAWLMRVEPTPQHREWLERIAMDLIATMEPNGALPERLQGSGGGHYQVPQSNELFGVGESPLLQENADPVTDQLYTTAFALIALHEAAAVTSSPKVLDAENRLARYLCRIQVRSEAYPYLDGAWLRAFDYKKWDYWASSGDIGWGPWCAETGWGHVWIATTLGLRAQSTTLWDLLTSRDLTPHWKSVETEMFGG